MRSIYTLAIALLLTINSWAQAPQKMSYQAVIRNSSNTLIASSPVGMQISILQGSASGTVIYTETQTTSTNSNGLVSIEIGNGTIVSGTFTAINWAAGPYFIKTETDPTGGTAYTISGTSELLSVPYAIHAKTAESITGGITETDPVFATSPANGITSTNISNWNNKLDAEVDGSVTNELQALSISNDTIYLSNGGYVKLPAGFDGNYNNLTNTPSNVSAFNNDSGYLTTEMDGSVTNELQTLSISNDTVYLSNGGFVKLPSSNAWSLNGNSATVDGTHFIGTTDNVALNFRVNNQKAGRIDAIGSTLYGYQSGNSITSGIHNTANGYQSLFSNTTGNNNTAVGYYALRLNTFGGQNTAVGDNALAHNTSAIGNTSIGYATLAETTTGNFNSALGYDALLYNTTGEQNTAVGAWALHFNTIGKWNTALGFSSLQKNISGNNNTSIGQDAGYNNTSGNGNVFIGYRAGYNETASNKLYIANSSTNPPLIYGDFATGNIGLGNNNPSARLHIGNGTRFAASSDASIFLQSGDGAGSARDWKIYVPMTSGYLGFRDMGFDNLNNGMSADAMVIQSGTGNVGIGTTSPSAKLQVETYGFSNKTIWGMNSVLIQNQTPNSRTLLALAPNGTQNADFVIFHNSDYTTNYESLYFGYENTLNHFNIGTNKGGTGTVRPLVLDATGAGTNLWKQLVLATNGNVGIGTLTPGAALEVNGAIKVTGGTASQFLKADGSLDANTYLTAIVEVTDEFSATAAQTSFTLTQTPSANSKVKMYINGVRISNTAYSVTGSTLTYVTANNGAYVLSAGDRIQFDYSY